MLAAKTAPSGIREELGIARQAPLVGIIARLDPQKGQHDAIRAFAQVLRRFPTGNLLIVGSETSWHAGYEASLKKLVADLDVSDSVWFLGHRNDVPQILSNLDVFVHPAHNEPFGLAVAEASAAGLPVVAYADGATPELIDDGVTGLLSPRSDSIEGLAKNLETLMSNPERSREIGMLGRSRMQAQFSGADAVRNFRLAIIRVMSSVPGGTNSVATSRNVD